MGNPKIISPSAIAGQHQEQERICLNLDQVVLDDAGDDDQEQQKELQVIACLPLAVSGDNQDQEDSDQNDKTEPKQNIYIGAVQEKYSEECVIALPAPRISTFCAHSRTG